MPKNPNNVNQKAMLAVADVIEYTDRFYIGSWVGKLDEEAAGVPDPNYAADPNPLVWDRCDTAACVAGWTAVWADRNPKVEGISYSRIGAQELGLTNTQAGKLFYPGDGWWLQFAPVFGWKTKGSGAMKYLLNVEEITASQAATVLRLVATGLVKL